MKPEQLNRHGETVTTVTHDAQPLPTPLLDAAVERVMFPLLHQVIDKHMEAKPKRQYHMESICECGNQGRSVCRPIKTFRVYEDPTN